MKNLFRLLLIFLPLYAMASVDVGNWRVSSYDIETKTAVLRKYLGSSTSVTVPNGITINVFDSSDNKKKDIYFNTKLGSSLFKDNNTIVSVSLGNHSIIPSWCFSGCSSLKNVSGAYGVTMVDGRAFNGCTSLESFEGFATVTNIGSSAFSGCSSLTGVIELPVAESVGSSAFQKCVSIISFSAPKLINMEDYVFDGCSSLNDVYISGSYVVKRGLFQNCSKLERVTLIGDSARFADSFFHSTNIYNYWRPPFAGCTNLHDVVLGRNFTSIPRETFNGLSSLTNVTVTSSLTDINDKAFSGCSSLESFEGFSTVTNIGENAFSGCHSLSGAIELPMANGVGAGAFRECTSLTSFVAPQLSVLGQETFVGCTDLKECLVGGDAIICLETFLNCSRLEKVSLLGNTQFADSFQERWAWRPPFGGCTNLREIVLGENFTWIPRKTFNSLQSLTNVTVTSSLTNIYDKAFSGCKSLKSLKGAGSVTGIGGSAFSGCSSLESFDFTMVTNIGLEAFKGNYILNFLKQQKTRLTFYR